jgi:hypothetical protein
MAASVDAMNGGCEWRERAAPMRSATASQQKELGWWSRGGVAGRPVWSRAVHDRKARRRNGAFEDRITESECGRSNPRFEPTPRHRMKGPGYEGAMNSTKPVAVRSAVLSRMIAARHPAARGSSACR